MTKLSVKKLITTKSRKIRLAKNGKILKACPCPIHQGRELPIESFGAARDKVQGYCREYRSQREREKYQEKKKPQEKNQAARLKSRLEIATDKMLTRCKECGLAKETNNFNWQSNGRGGFRQPCKKCLKNKSTKVSEKA